jgi:hypothetical protein
MSGHDGLRVWVVSDTGKYAGVVGVYASEGDAFEDVDVRSGRGERPDIRHRLRVESWPVQASATPPASDPVGLDVERLAEVLNTGRYTGSMVAARAWAEDIGRRYAAYQERSRPEEA